HPPSLRATTGSRRRRRGRTGTEGCDIGREGSGRRRFETLRRPSGSGSGRSRRWRKPPGPTTGRPSSYARNAPRLISRRPSAPEIRQ
ncbi:unnamed protein product, partial [Linum tenue]